MPENEQKVPIEEEKGLQIRYALRSDEDEMTITITITAAALTRLRYPKAGHRET